MDGQGWTKLWPGAGNSISVARVAGAQAHRPPSAAIPCALAGSWQGSGALGDLPVFQYGMP